MEIEPKVVFSNDLEARVDARKKIADTMEELANDCHDAQTGRFCETHGVYHEDHGEAESPSSWDLMMEGLKKNKAKRARAKALMNLEMSYEARVRAKEKLAEQFHGTHDEKSHGSWAEGEEDFQAGDIIEYKERGAMLGQVSDQKSKKGYKYLKVMWDDGSVADVARDEIKIVRDKRKDTF